MGGACRRVLAAMARIDSVFGMAGLPTNMPAAIAQWCFMQSLQIMFAGQHLPPAPPAESSPAWCRWTLQFHEALESCLIRLCGLGEQFKTDAIRPASCRLIPPRNHCIPFSRLGPIRQQGQTLTLPNSVDIVSLMSCRPLTSFQTISFQPQP